MKKLLIALSIVIISASSAIAAKAELDELIHQ